MMQCRRTTNHMDQKGVPYGYYCGQYSKQILLAKASMFHNPVGAFRRRVVYNYEDEEMDRVSAGNLPGLFLCGLLGGGAGGDGRCFGGKSDGGRHPGRELGDLLVSVRL